MHRVRSQWMATRTARIDAMRGMLRELGVTSPLGAERFLTDLHHVLEHNRERLPDRIRRLVTLLQDEVRELESRIEAVEEELGRIAKEGPVIRTLLQVPGIGVLTATALETRDPGGERRHCQPAQPHRFSLVRKRQAVSSDARM